MPSMLRLSAIVALLALVALPAEAGRDGSGTYSLPSVYSVQAGDTIQPEQTMDPFEDIESTLNTARPVSVGGTGATTAAAARSNLSAQAITRANDTTGSSNAYALASEVAFTSLTDGDFVLFVANHSNTGAATLNVDGLGAKNLQKAVDGTPTALASGDIDSGGHYLATYDASVGSGTWIVHAVPRAFLDEDDMASNSATAVASQQSVKAYVDNNVQVTQRGSPTNTTSGTSVDVTGVTAVDSFDVFLNAVSTDGTSNLILQIGDSGGIETPGYTSVAVDNTSALQADTAGFQVTNTNPAVSTWTGIVSFRRSTGNVWFVTLSIYDEVDSTKATYGSGKKTLSGTLDRFRITTDGGTDNFDNGTINWAGQ